MLDEPMDLAGDVYSAADYLTTLPYVGAAGIGIWRDLARAEGRLYGIGFAAVVEPSVSNMGYITTVLSPQERQKAGPKGGAQAAATVALDPLGGVSVAIDSVPQGQVFSPRLLGPRCGRPSRGLSSRPDPR